MSGVLGGGSIKRIIGGKTYNTDTSSLIHETDVDPAGLRRQALYQTRHGAFFLFWADTEIGEGGLKPLSDSEALEWLERVDVDAAVIEGVFGAFPEAGAAEVRTTLRLPGNLHQRVSASAEAAKLSLNTYIMRLLESSESHATDGER
jgi:HicB-like protein involved in pilus formation